MLCDKQVIYFFFGFHVLTHVLIPVLAAHICDISVVVSVLLLDMHVLSKTSDVMKPGSVSLLKPQ